MLLIHDIRLAIVLERWLETSLRPTFACHRTLDFRAFLCLKPRGGPLALTTSDNVADTKPS
jgi:hypothetical protein